MTESKPAPDSLSVLVLTRDRLKQLRRCLRSLEEQTAPPDEVVVVDTGSSDGTREWLAEYAANASFRVVARECERGSFAEARNNGLQATTGALIAILDDDCSAQPEWAARIRRGLAECDALGGAVIPGEQLAFPRWWHGELNWLIGLSSPGLYDETSGAVHYPSTSNLAARRTVFDRIPFRGVGTEFKRGYAYLGGREDSQFWRETRRAGFRTRIDPRCVVLHHFGHERFNKREVLRRAYADGRAFWLRERQETYVRQAVTDFQNTHVRWIARMREPDHEGLWAEIASSALWSFRQFGFLTAYATTPPRLTHAFKATGAFLRQLPLSARDAIKRPLRRVLVSARRRRGLIPELKRGPRRLLVVCFGFLGDTVIIEPACRAYQAANPGCELFLLTHPQGAALHRSTGIWSEIITTQAAEATPEELTAIKELGAETTVIPYFHREDRRLLDRITRALPCATFEFDVGFSRRLDYEWCGTRVKKDFERNEILNVAALFSAVGNPRKPEPYRWKFDAQDESGVEWLLGKGIDPTAAVLVHFGSVEGRKRWPLERWSELCRRIVGELGRSVVLVSGPAEDEEGARLAAEVGERCINGCRQFGPRELGALLYRAPLLVTGDSGPKHLAFACGAPTVTLYGPSNERRWGALWEHERHRRASGGNHDLSAEEMHGLPEDYLMRNIQVDTVFDLIQESLQR